MPIENVLARIAAGGWSKLSKQPELSASDPYVQRMEATLEQMNRSDYPSGMILWLEEVNPRLYAQLTEHSPDEIHRLWSSHAPLVQFEDALKCLVETHQTACALYQAHLTAPRRPVGQK